MPNQMMERPTDAAQGGEKGTRTLLLLLLQSPGFNPCTGVMCHFKGNFVGGNAVMFFFFFLLHQRFPPVCCWNTCVQNCKASAGCGKLAIRAHKQDLRLKLFINVCLFLFTAQQHPCPFLSVLPHPPPFSSESPESPPPPEMRWIPSCSLPPHRSHHQSLLAHFIFDSSQANSHVFTVRDRRFHQRCWN